MEHLFNSLVSVFWFQLLNALSLNLLSFIYTNINIKKINKILQNSYNVRIKQSVVYSQSVFFSILNNRFVLLRLWKADSVMCIFVAQTPFLSTQKTLPQPELTYVGTYTRPALKLLCMRNTIYTWPRSKTFPKSQFTDQLIAAQLL